MVATASLRRILLANHRPFPLWLRIEPNVTIPSYVPLRDPIIDVLRKYDNYPSVVLIKNNIQCTQTIEFQPISCVDIVN